MSQGFSNGLDGGNSSNAKRPKTDNRMLTVATNKRTEKSVSCVYIGFSIKNTVNIVELQNITQIT